MENFFDFSLKIGKKFVFVLICLLFCAIILSVIVGVMSFIPEKTEIPVFSKVLAQQETLYGNDTKPKDHNGKKVSKYIIIIDEIVKENDLNNFGRSVIVKHIENISDDVKEEYTKGLKPFLKDYYTYMNGKDITEQMLRATLSDYEGEFIANNAVKEINQATKNISRVISISVFVSCILIFLLCLFFPLLVRIEENTRK